MAYSLTMQLIPFSDSIDKKLPFYRLIRLHCQFHKFYYIPSHVKYGMNGCGEMQIQ